MSRKVRRLWKNTTKEICEGFGNALDSGQTPKIEEFLNQIEDGEKIAGFYGLLTREIDYLDGAGRRFDGNAYRERFPEYREVVESVLFRDEQMRLLLRDCGYTMVHRIATQRTGDIYKAQNVETTGYESVTRIPSFMLRQRIREGGRFDFTYMNHPGIARPSNVIQAPDNLLVATDYVEGVDAASLVRKQPLALCTAAEIVRRTAEAMAWIHAHGQVHGTLSPTSLILSHDSGGLPAIKICGLAFYQLADASLSRYRAPNLQEFNWKMFVPPESANEVNEIQFSGDVFSMGQILLYLLSSRPNRSFACGTDWAASCIEELPRSLATEGKPSETRRAEQVIDLIQSAVSEIPEKRPAAGELAAKLAEFSEPASLQTIGARLPQKGSLESGQLQEKLKAGLPAITRPAARSVREVATRRIELATIKNYLFGKRSYRIAVVGLPALVCLGFFSVWEAHKTGPSADNMLRAIPTLSPAGSDMEGGMGHAADLHKPQPRGQSHSPADLEQRAYKPDLYMLTIGVSQYQNPEYNLAVADSDAKILAKMFRDGGAGIFDKVSIRTLTNSEANKNSILEQLQWLQSETTQNDLAIVTISGHGVTDEFDDFFFLPYDFDTTKSMAFSAVAWDDIHRWLRRIPCNIWLVMDTCHSGGVTRIGARGMREREMDRAMKKALRTFSEAPKGLVIMAASLGQQSALENADWGHGALTLALLEGLTGQYLIRGGHRTQLPSQRMQDGILSLGELDHYASRRVKELTNGKQAVVTNHSGNIDMYGIPIRFLKPPRLE